MAKQSKATVEKRKVELKGFGYTEQELAQPDILESIENTTAGNWGAIAEGFKKKKEDAIPFTEAEHIEPEKPMAPGLTDLATRIEKEVETGIATFDANEATIAEWKTKYAHLKFTSLDDTENNNLILEGWRTARTTRLALEKREEFLKAPFIAASKKIGGVADKYYMLLAAIENPLKEQRALIEAAKEEEKNKLAIEAEKEGTRRVDVLKEAGMTFGGQFYEIGETISMDYATIKAMTPEDFEKLLGKVQAEKKRLDDEEAKRLEDLKKERLSTRGNMLDSIGMWADTNGTYTSEHLEGVKVMTECLTDEPDDTFMKLFSSLSTRINDAKIKAKDEADKKAKERTVALRSKLIIATGMNRVDWIPGTTQTGFYFKNDFVEIKLPLPFVESATDEEFDARIEQYEQQILDARAQAAKKEADDKAAEQLANTRREQLIGLGMTSAPKLASYVFTLPDATTQCSVAYGEITGQSPEAWEATMNDVRFTINKILLEQQDFETKAEQDKKDKAEKEVKEAMTFQQRQYDLVNLKMVIVAGEFIIRNEYGFAVKISIEEVKAIDEDMWPAKLTEITGLVDNLKKHTEEQRQAEIDKAEALKPEVQKVKEYLSDVLNMELPIVGNGDLSLIVNDFYKELTTAIEKAVNKLEATESK